MADNITLDVGAGGDVLAADEVGGAKHQRVKVEFGSDGTATEVDADNPLPINQGQDGTQNLIISRYLDDVGDGSGNKNANGDYTTPDIFFIQPGAGEIYRIARLIISVEDGTGFTAVKYGNLAALTNGIQIRVQGDSGTIIDLTDNVPIKSNSHYGRTCYDVALKDWGAGDQLLCARWTFEKHGQMLRLDGDADGGERLEVLLSDNFTGINFHYFLAQGYKESDPT